MINEGDEENEEGRRAEGGGGARKGNTAREIGKQRM